MPDDETEQAIQMMVERLVERFDPDQIIIPQWQIATLGAGSKIKSPLEELLRDNFWPDDATGAWTIPTLAQREILRRRRTKPQQLPLGLEVEGEQMALGLK